MSYLRFLTDNDYLTLVTQEHMGMIVRDITDRIPQAEQSAEMKMREYLDQYYDINKVLAVGKNIRDYSVSVCYPAGVHFKKDGKIYKTLTAINGHREPTKDVYWRQVVEFVDPKLIEQARRYSQLRMYSNGEIVQFGTDYWQCLIPHGYEAGEIHLPGVEVWKEVEVTSWEPNMEWEKDQVCSYNEQFYQYLKETADTDESTDDGTADSTGQTDTEEETTTTTDGATATTDEEVLTPEEDDNWGLIGDYDKEYQYSFAEDDHDYVVSDGAVFYPVLNPNADALTEGVNITRDDPRHPGVVAHMTSIALYYLHRIVSPTNIPETRREDYEDAVLWLSNASKFKINPQLPRKIDCETGERKVDWALETFQRSYNPFENPWLI